jgi:hypothetical protein
VIIPLPQKSSPQRVCRGFTIIGNVFTTGDRYLFLGRGGQPNKYEFEYEN